MAIAGELPWMQAGQQAGALQGLTGSPQQVQQRVGDAYANSYNSALALNAANYQNILGGYQQTMGQQTTAQDAIGRGYTDLYNQLQQQQQGVVGGYGANLAELQGNQNAIMGGYGQLSSDVLGTIAGIGQEQAQQIRSNYAQSTGSALQGLTSRGLGNTTVANSIQRGIDFDRARAENALAEQMAGLRAGYQSQLGLAGLGYQANAALQAANQRNIGLGYQADAASQLAAQRGRELGFLNDANMQNTNLAQNQLRFMEGVSAPYPDMAAFQSIVQQSAAAQQQAADRQALQDAQRAQLGAAAQAGQGGGGGFARAPSGMGPLTGGPTMGPIGGGTLVGTSPGYQASYATGGIGASGLNMGYGAPTMAPQSPVTPTPGYYMSSGGSSPGVNWNAPANALGGLVGGMGLGGGYATGSTPNVGDAFSGVLGGAGMVAPSEYGLWDDWTGDWYDPTWDDLEAQIWDEWLDG